MISKARLKKSLHLRKVFLDQYLTSGKAVLPGDLGPLSIFYLWWGLEHDDQKAVNLAKKLRDLSIVAALSDRSRDFSLVRSGISNAVCLKIWQEIVQDCRIPTKVIVPLHDILRGKSTDVFAADDNYELLRGATGLGLVAFHLDCFDVVNKALLYLSQTLEKSKYGWTYYGQKHYLSRALGINVEKKYVITGLAHGVAAPLLFARRMSQEPRFRKIAADVFEKLNESVSTMLDETLGFPHSYYPAPDTRLQMLPNWCMTSPGLDFARGTVPKHLLNKKFQFVETGLCHGYWGAFHLCRRMGLPTDGVLGCANPNAFKKAPPGTPMLLFLEGPLGEALAILDSLSKIKVPWDRTLLLSE